MTRLALLAIAIVTPPIDRDAVVGDTIERLDEVRQARGPRAARRWLWREAIRVTLGAIRHRRAARAGRLPRPTKDARMTWMFRGWLTDARHGLRSLSRAPGHVLTAIACLGIGIVASVSVFSIVNALFYSPLPGLADRDRLVRAFLTVDEPGAVPGSASLDEITALRSAPRIAEMLASEGDISVTTVVDGEARRAVAAFVSGNYFGLLGTPAGRGRVLTAYDDRPDADPVVVISDAFWRRQLAARPDVVGHSIVIAGRPFTIVGVAPERFGGLELSELGEAAGSRLQFWLPLSAAANWPGAPSPASPWHAMVVRLPPGATAETAASDLTAVARTFTRGTPPVPVRAVTSPLNAGPGDVGPDIAIMLSLFFFVPLAVLAIGCANVANLQLARATERAREISVRLSLGASRLAIVRLLTIEAVALATIAGAAGLAGTAVVLRSLESFMPLPLDIDWRVLIFTSILIAGVVVLAGLAPAWLASRRPVGSSQRETTRAGGLGHSKLRRTLVGLQIALSLVLLVVGGLFGRALQAMYVEAPAVIRELLLVDLNLGEVGFTDADRTQLVRSITVRLGGDQRIVSVAAEGRRNALYRPVSDDRREAGVRTRIVMASWFRTMDMRPVAGRVLTVTDGPSVAVVNRQFAQTLLSPPGPGPGADVDVRVAVGQAVWVRDSDADTPRVVEIVGVVADAPRAPDPHDDPAIYSLMVGTPPVSLSFVIRTADPAILLPELRRRLSDIEPRIPWAELTTGEAVFARDVDPYRYLVLAASALGVVALMLAAAGLYALMSYAVVLRRHEIGVRMAIGARPSDILRLVLGQSLRLAAIGLVVGVALVVPLTDVAKFLFLGVSPLDPVAMLVPLVVLLLTAVVAGAFPARRAARIDPVQALRQD